MVPFPAQVPRRDGCGYSSVSLAVARPPSRSTSRATVLHGVLGWCIVGGLHGVRWPNSTWMRMQVLGETQERGVCLDRGMERNSPEGTDHGVSLAGGMVCQRWLCVSVSPDPLRLNSDRVTYQLWPLGRSHILAWVSLGSLGASGA